MIRCVKLNSDHWDCSLIIFPCQSLNVIECVEFRALLMLLWSELKETAIPHRTKLRQLIVEAWKRYFHVLKGDLAVSVSAIVGILQAVRGCPIQKGFSNFNNRPKTPSLNARGISLSFRAL